MGSKLYPDLFEEFLEEKLKISISDIEEEFKEWMDEKCLDAYEAAEARKQDAAEHQLDAFLEENTGP